MRWLWMSVGVCWLLLAALILLAVLGRVLMYRRYRDSTTANLPARGDEYDG